jgi:hypothetical protein
VALGSPEAQPIIPPDLREKSRWPVNSDVGKYYVDRWRNHCLPTLIFSSLWLGQIQASVARAILCTHLSFLHCVDNLLAAFG